MGYFSLSKMFSSRKKKERKVLKVLHVSSGRQGEHCRQSLDTNEEDSVAETAMVQLRGPVKTSEDAGTRKKETPLCSFMLLDSVADGFC